MKNYILLSALAAFLIPSISNAGLAYYTVKKVKLFPEITVAIDNGPFPDCTIKFVDSMGQYRVEEKNSILSITVEEVPLLLADVTVKEVKSALTADITVSGTKDLIVAAAACKKVRK